MPSTYQSSELIALVYCKLSPSLGKQKGGELTRLFALPLHCHARPHPAAPRRTVPRPAPPRSARPYSEIVAGGVEPPCDHHHKTTLALRSRAVPRPAIPRRALPGPALPHPAVPYQALPDPANNGGRESNPPTLQAPLPTLAMQCPAEPSQAVHSQAMPYHAQPGHAMPLLYIETSKLIPTEHGPKRAEPQRAAHVERLPQVLQGAELVFDVLHGELDTPRQRQHWTLLRVGNPTLDTGDVLGLADLLVPAGEANRPIIVTDGNIKRVDRRVAADPQRYRLAVLPEELAAHALGVLRHEQRKNI